MATSARNVHFTLDNAAGTPVTLSTYLKSIDLNDDIGLEDATVFGAAVVAKSNCVTLREGGFSIKAPFHATLHDHLRDVKGGLTAGGSLSFVYGPTGSTSTMERITGECFLKSLKRSGEVGELLMIEAEFVYDGTITEDAF